MPLADRARRLQRGAEAPHPDGLHRRQPCELGHAQLRFRFVQARPTPPAVRPCGLRPSGAHRLCAADAGPKTVLPRDLRQLALREGNGIVSTQVLQEFDGNATNKLGLERDAARARLEAYLGFDVVALPPPLLVAAVDRHRVDSVSCWDAVVIRAAEHAGCHTLSSEHLQAGRRFGSVRVVNPFG
jgi:predicted nucleic acid-binding protein